MGDDELLPLAKRHFKLDAFHVQVSLGPGANAYVGVAANMGVNITSVILAESSKEAHALLTPVLRYVLTCFGKILVAVATRCVGQKLLT